MKKVVSIVFAVASSLSAAPITTYVEGHGVPGPDMQLYFTGAGVKLEAGARSGSFDTYSCRLDRTCQIQDFITGANLYYVDPEPDAPYVSAMYHDFQLGYREPASIYLQVTWSKFFGLDTKVGPFTVPVDVFGRIQLGQPGTDRYYDLRLHARGTETLYLNYVPDVTGAPPWVIDVIPPLTMYPGSVTFSGELTEAPEPTTAGPALVCLLAAALVANRRRFRRVR